MIASFYSSISLEQHHLHQYFLSIILIQCLEVLWDMTFRFHIFLLTFFQISISSNMFSHCSQLSQQSSASHLHCAFYQCVDDCNLQHHSFRTLLIAQLDPRVGSSNFRLNALLANFRCHIKNYKRIAIFLHWLCTLTSLLLLTLRFIDSQFWLLWYVS